MNKVLLAGRISRDAEVRTTGSDKKFLTFSLALEEFYGGEKHVSFINVSHFPKEVENLAPYLKKGTAVSIEARLTSTIKEDKHYMNVTADRVELLSSSNSNKINELEAKDVKIEVSDKEFAELFD